MKILPDWLVLCVWRALIGEIYPAIRAIALSLANDGTLLICYYLDRQPTDFDWESLEVVATNISASIGQDKIPRIELECKFELGSIGRLECFGGFVYCRREYDLQVQKELRARRKPQVLWTLVANVPIILLKYDPYRQMLKYYSLLPTLSRMLSQSDRGFFRSGIREWSVQTV